MDENVNKIAKRKHLCWAEKHMFLKKVKGVMHGEAVMLCSSRLKHLALQYSWSRGMLTCVCMSVCVGVGVCGCGCVRV